MDFRVKRRYHACLEKEAVQRLRMMRSVEEKEAKLVKDVFSLRLENKSYSTIAKILKEKYSKKINFDFNA